MLSFDEVQGQITIAHKSYEAAHWAVYHVSAHPFKRSHFDWGPALLYYFSGGAPALRSWMELVEALASIIAARPALGEVVELVPFSTVGSDFFIQAKPPDDGGYTTSRYAEFLEYGDCRPNRDLLCDLAELHARVLEHAPLGQMREQSRAGTLCRVLHASLVRPYERLFWGTGRWNLYYPAISSADLTAWEELGAADALS